MLAAAIALAVLIGISALGIVLSQHHSRAQLQRNLAMRGSASATFVSTYVVQQAGRLRVGAERALSERTVSPGRFRLLLSAIGSSAALLVDSSGRVLDVVPADSSPVAERIAARYAHLAATGNRQVVVSDVVPSANAAAPVVAVAVPFSTPYGRRVLSVTNEVTGSTLQTFLDHTISYPQHAVYLVDSAGHLVAASPPTSARRLSEADPALAHALEHATLGAVAGASTPTTFTAVAVPGTPWRVAIAVPDSRLYVSVSGLMRLIPWLILAFVSVLGVAVVVLQVLARARDLKQRRQAAELAEQLRHAQKLDAIGRLAGGVAHDFNNMLTAIQGYSQLLLDGLEDEDPLRSSAEQISRAATQAASLPRQLLAFSRKQQPAPREPIDLNESLRSASDMISRLVDPSIDLVVAPDAAAPQVLADPGYLEQVILNLAVNASEAMPDGGTLTIATRNADPAQEGRSGRGAGSGPHVVLVVADTGRGMEAATRESIFEPFFTTKPGNSGLGLATVYGIVGQCDGFIHVESEPALGSSFEVWLPCTDAIAAPTRALAEPEAERDGAGTVLVVEDERLVRELAVTVLADAGYRVLSAEDADEALALSAGRRTAIDALVADIVLPGMSGCQLAQLLVADKLVASVVLMSGHSDEVPAIRGDGEVGWRFLQKPFRPDELLACMSELIGDPAAAVSEDRMAASPSTTCVVADDHPAVLDAVSRFLERSGIDVVARVSSGDRALDEIRALNPSLALLDARMPALTGVEVARRASADAPETRTVLYTGYGDRALLAQALDAGARGFIRKDAPLNEVVQALVTVAEGETYVDPELAETLASGELETLSPLTPREQQVLALVADGLTNEKVAGELGISAETVQSHIRNAMGKLDADTRTQAVATALRRSLLV